MREWQAYNDLKKKIDDFSGLCPLLEQMLDKSMKSRHWKRIEEVTCWKLDVDCEGFILRNVMEAPLIKNMEDIEVGIEVIYKMDEIIICDIYLGYLHQCC